MQKINVSTHDNFYNIYVNESFNALNKILLENQLTNKKIAIITDSNVDPLYSTMIMEELSSLDNEIYKFVFNAGETSKNIETIQKIYKYLIENNFDRDSLLVALGGGVVGDITGFVAATYMRGVRYIQVPTTLLAQVDSSVGGKTGFDFLDYKNIIGAFYQPQLVYVNVNTLKTLPKREFSAGMSEVIKYGLIRDNMFFDFLQQNSNRILNLESEALISIIRRCCEIKAEIVSIDEKENGLRAILNYGHTFGHAIETLNNFKLLHGECVSIGSIMSAKLSHNMGLITENEFLAINDIFKKYRLPVSITNNLMPNDIYTTMLHDKKTKNSKIKFILLEHIGNTKITDTVDKVSIKEIIQYCKDV